MTAPHIYVPEDPDPLRDGLFAGFWRHRQQQPGNQPAPPPEPPQPPPSAP